MDLAGVEIHCALREAFPDKVWASPRCARPECFRTSLRCGRGYATMLRISFRFLTRGWRGCQRDSMIIRKRLPSR